MNIELAFDMLRAVFKDNKECEIKIKTEKYNLMLVKSAIGARDCYYCWSLFVENQGKSNDYYESDVIHDLEDFIVDANLAITKYLSCEALDEK